MSDHSNPNPSRAEAADVALEALHKSRHDPELHDAVVATILDTLLTPAELKQVAKMAGYPKPTPFVSHFGNLRPRPVRPKRA